MKFVKDLTASLKNVYRALPTSGIVLLMIAAFLIVAISTRALPREGIQSRHDNFLFKTGAAVYDDFYSEIYDFLVYNDTKDEYEIGAIMNRTNPTTQSRILDIGSGTGHHVATLAKHGLDVVGVDVSPSMVAKAKANYPKYRFVVGNVLDGGQFPMASFTHILCLYFTIYYFQDKMRFFRNCYDWLMPGGFLVVHLVDREKFDPILPSGNPLFIVSPQRYAKERITKSKVAFDKFKYESNFAQDRDDPARATFSEKFMFADGTARRHEHQFFMEPHQDILTMAQQAGFTVAGQIDLVKCAYEYQYLYILTKPAN